MKKFDKNSTNSPRERPSEGGLYRSEGNTLYLLPEVAKKLEEAWKLLLEQIEEEEKR